MDKRRAMLKQAGLYRNQSRAEREQIVNDLVFDALSVYWNWARDYRLFTLLRQTVQVNEARYAFIRMDYLQGNRPAIDTVEALAQLQQFQFLENEAALKFRNTGIELSAFLWKDNNLPYLLPESVLPDTLWEKATDPQDIPVLEDLLSVARRDHPKLKQYQIKLDVLAIEQRLRFQGLLPRVDLKANLLNKGYSVLSGVKGNFLENNYRFGFDISVPLRFSEGRGSYKEIKLKRAATGLDFQFQQQLVENKVKTYYFESLNFRQQIILSEKAQENFQKLLSGELTRFQIGESSLFLVNTRELKALEAQQKVVEVKTKYYKSRAGVIWATGQLR